MFCFNKPILGLKEAISTTFEEAGVEDWKEKLVAFGADGASVNLGKKAGVAALLKKDIPYLVDFHCLPHRLELALLELQGGCKSVEDVYSILHLIWKTYHYSPKSVGALKSIADELEINILKPTQVKGTRWLPHVSRALKVFVSHTSATESESGQYAAVLMHMEDLSVNCKNADIQGRARHVSQKMKDIHFAAFCHFLADLFAILSRLSLQMQRNDIILPSVVSHLKETLVRIESVTRRPVADGHLAKFWKKVEGTQTFQGVTLTGSIHSTAGKRGGSISRSLQSEMETAASLTLQGLRDRFGVLLGIESQVGKSPSYDSTKVVSDMLVFNVDSWPTRPGDLLDFGSEEIRHLTRRFQPILERAGCKISSIQDQWISLKIMVNGQLRKLNYGSLWETLLTKVPYKDDFKDVLHLVELVLVLPISAAQCERAVSAQNRIKSSTRATLSVSVLEDLIRLSSEGPPVAEFDPTPAVNRWFERDRSKGERARRPHFLNQSSGCV